MDLKEVESIASKCKLCSLWENRINPVFAKGNSESKILICGMVPAHEENKQGVPFVGRAGKCLDLVLETVGLSLESVYITNIVKCCLSPGIKLKKEWVSSCLPFLLKQIDLIDPKVVITLGADATNGFLGFDMDTKIGSLRGNVYYNGILPVIPTYHPSYLVRGGFEKSPGFPKVKMDFEKAKELIQ